jgi:hypothetical protein
MDPAAVARKLNNLTEEVKRTLSRLHREGRSELDMIAQLLVGLYPKTVPTWSGTSAVTLDLTDLLVPQKIAQGERPLSPFDFACAFLDPASTTARLVSFKPPIASMMVELGMLGVEMSVEAGEVPPLEGLSYADSMRVLLAGALGKKMLADANVAAEYERRRRLVGG